MKEQVNKQQILQRKNPWLRDFVFAFIEVPSGVLAVKVAPYWQCLAANVNCVKILSEY